MLESVLTGRPARSVAEVLALMHAIDAALPDDDGVKWFNRLYLRVTAAVAAELAVAGTAPSGDDDFLARLDVEFANLYFDAAAAGDRTPRLAPPAWRPLFECRRQPLARLQFALAGMNAHINRDLPEALSRTYAGLGGAPRRGDARHAAYVAVNDVLARVEETAKAELLVNDALVHLDQQAGEIDDRLAMWKVGAARDAAWTHFEVLWALRALPVLRTDFFAKLDRMTGFAGRGLLAPLPRFSPARVRRGAHIG